MNDTAIKNFAVWARRQLIEDVKQQMVKWAIDEQGTTPATADVLNGNVLTPQQRKQRAELLRLCKAKGTEQLAEQAAYTWFNRFLAIRFMELHDYLPCGLRFFSSAGGAFDPQVLKEALRVEIEGLDRNQVLAAIREGDEPLFRTLFIAQCNELADCMPAVFEHVGSAMELLLPDNLLRDGGVLSHMVLDISESDWLEGVEIVGWMYQYYVSERKDEVFASFKKGKKAERDAIAPATQLFTPHWIVRYLTENSLGRLWMLNHPDSHLVDKVDYYIAPDADAHEDVLPISSPEEITLCDSACGSGHILVYAFDVLAAIYEECGYMRRDIPRLILEKNLAGMEIDPRAAAMASFALAMKAMEWDSRFLSRRVSPDITVLQPVTFEAEELEKYSELAKQQHLLEIAAHMDECGSLFLPDSIDIATLESIKNDIEDEVDIFTSNTADKVQQIIDLFKSLARTFTVVVANPPYMGSKNMNSWMSAWVKKNYPDVKSDLFSAFIARNLTFAKPCGELGFMTPYVWMFIGSYEKLRNMIIRNKTITSLVQLEYSGFEGATVPICTFTLHNAHIDGYKGSYVRLSDFVGAQNQAPKTLEAITNPDCGWFYRADADTFKDIPGTPIAYWLLTNPWVLSSGQNVKSRFESAGRVKTHANEKYIRYWWETPFLFIGKKWIEYSNGGGFARWGGLREEVVDWSEEALAEYSSHGGLPNPKFLNTRGICWGLITSSIVSFRPKDKFALYSSASPTIVSLDNDSEDECYLLAFLNSNVARMLLNVLNPTLNTTVHDVLSLPLIMANQMEYCISLAKENLALVDKNSESRETSKFFSRHPML